ncbi:MAG: universal stress protein [Syntrophales bacterium]|nr:universal stress protein [Syntrophales bacterium]
MIPQVKKILYTTDLSKNSVYAFYHAVDMAKKYDAKICMLHVIETIPASAYGTRTDKLYQDQREAAEAVIRNRIRNFCDRVDQKKNLACMERIARILVENGDPAQEILKAAEQEGCNLMVLGRHGKGFLEQTFLGSVSRSVMDRAKMPVLVIPVPSEEASVWDEI